MPQGQRQPSVAGVYDNVIRGNVVTQQRPQGRGRRRPVRQRGTGHRLYDNLVQGNYIAGNELAGVTLHAHTLGPGQFEDLSGNKVIGNAIGTNNLGGDPLDLPGLTRRICVTTGVLVFSGGTPVTVTIAFNLISNNHYRHLAQQGR